MWRQGRGRFVSVAVCSIDERKRIVAPVAQKHGADCVSLFGSYARGAATETGDVDL